MSNKWSDMLNTTKNNLSNYQTKNSFTANTNSNANGTSGLLANYSSKNLTPTPTANGTNNVGGIGLLSNYSKANSTPIATTPTTTESDTNDGGIGLLSNYSLQKENLLKDKQVAQQNASIAYDKSMKYLPTQLKAMGLGGLGVSQTALIQAQNDYLNNLSELERNYSSNLADINMQEAEYKENERIIASEVVQGNYEDMLSGALAEDGGSLTEEGKTKLMNYLDANKDVLGDLVYYAYKSELDGKEVVSETETQNKENVLEGKESFIAPNGGKYKIKSQLDVDSPTLKTSFFKDSLNEEGFTDAYDPNILNGTTVKTHVYSWLTGWNEQYLTYYDGNWYISEEIKENTSQPKGNGGRGI